MSLIPSSIHPLDACILLAPAQPDQAAMTHGLCLAATVSAQLPVHVLIPDAEASMASECWKNVTAPCQFHRLPAQAGSSQTQALAAYLREHRILRPWVILWEPAFVRLATRAYAPAKAFVAGPWLSASAAGVDTTHAAIEHHHLHIFMTRQAGVVFSSDESADDFVRKELGYYGKVLPRQSWEAEWQSERDAAMADRATHTPHYCHKLEILVELETPTLKESAHAPFINQWMQCSRHRVRLCQHVEDTDTEAALRSREDYDVLLRVCEPAAGQRGPLTDWKSWHSVPGYKMLLIAESEASENLRGWANSHGVHHVLSSSIVTDHEVWKELDEFLQRQVHGLQNWVLQQPKQMVHHGPELMTIKLGAGGLDEIYEMQNVCARIWPLDFSDVNALHMQQREVIRELDDELARLGYRSKQDTGSASPSSILDSLRKRLTSLFR